ncbi:MAG: transcription antitermination factor NusB [Armatimonadetes bacterium]|nr:transcription antitermination factor NusB [Armatimonadota bacterium]
MSRRKARETALQALFQIEVGHTAPDAAFDACLERDPLSPKDRDFALKLVRGTLDHLICLDKKISGYCRNWDFSRISNVDKVLLRMASCEICYSPETPPQVAINEAVLLAKKYGGEESPGFVNAVLDHFFKDQQS